MARGYCPDCDEDIGFTRVPEVGTKLNCPHCDARLEVTDIDLVELNWARDEFDDDWGDDEDER